MAVFDLEERVEDAVKQVLINSATFPAEVSFYVGQENSEIKEPAVLIMLPNSDIPEDERSIEEVTGNRQGVLTVGIRTHSDYGRPNHRALTAFVRDLIHDDDFITTLNGLAEGVIIDRIEPSAAERSVPSGNSFVTAVQGSVLFRPKPTE